VLSREVVAPAAELAADHFGLLAACHGWRDPSRA
jgi:hypothetical protein